MKKRIAFGVVIGLLWLLFFVYLGYRQMEADTTQPVIAGEGPVELSVAEIQSDKSILLSGLTASDDKDGDLTEHILLEKIVKDDKGERNDFLLYYAVFDTAGNVTKAVKELRIRDYAEAVFGCNASLRFEEGTGVKLNGIVSVNDSYDGITQKNIVFDIPSEVLMGEAECGFYQGMASYTNSLGDTSTLEFYMEIYDEKSEMTSYGTNLILDEYVVYCDAEHPFAYEKNLITVKDNGVAYQVDQGSLYQYNAEDDTYRTVRDYENIHNMSNLVTEAIRNEQVGKWMNYRYVEFESDVDYSTPGTYVGTYTYASDMTGYVAKAMMQIVVR